MEIINQLTNAVNDINSKLIRLMDVNMKLIERIKELEKANESHKQAIKTLKKKVNENDKSN